MRDFAPVARVARMPIVLVASARFPPDSVQQFIKRERWAPLIHSSPPTLILPRKGKET